MDVMAQNGYAKAHNNYNSYLTANIPTWLSRLACVTEATEKTRGEYKSSSEDGSASQINKELLESAYQYLKRRECRGPSAMKYVIQATSTNRSNNGSNPSGQRINSDTSSQCSGKNHYRARNAINVMYDSTTQIHLEALVAEINTARRLIRIASDQMRREAANTRLLESLKQDDAIEVDSSDDDYASDKRESLDREFMMAQIRRQRQQRGSPPTRSSTFSKDGNSTASANSQRLERLTTMEECLQHAQDTCTIAAHQTLRDGQCLWETKAITEQLGEVWMAVKEDEINQPSNQSMLMDPTTRQHKTHGHPINSSTLLPKSPQPFDEYKIHQWHVQIVPEMGDT